MLLMIDNYDSFTYNLVQYLGELGEDVRVFRNDEITVDEVAQLKPARARRTRPALRWRSSNGWPGRSRSSGSASGTRRSARRLAAGSSGRCR